MNKFEKIGLIVLFTILVVIGIICKIYFPESNINNEIKEVQSELVKEITVSKEVERDVAETKEQIEKGKELDTTETIKSSIKEEQEVTDEGAEDNLEKDALVEQENISYDGDNTGKGTKLLGKWTGLTYYSQADSRWASKLYTSTGNRTQTMKSSACRTYKFSYDSIKCKRNHFTNYNS